MQRLLRNSWVLAGFSSAFLLGTSALQWVICDRYSVFAMVLLVPVVAFMVLTSIIVSLYALVRRAREDRWRAAMPLSITVIAVVLANTVPWTAIYLDYLWWRNERSYAEVVILVQSGQLKTAKDSSLVQLPKRFAGLSSDGQIRVEGTGVKARVFFYTFRGILDHASGYLFVPDDVMPKSGADDEYREVVQKKPHWYFVAS